MRHVRFAIVIMDGGEPETWRATFLDDLARRHVELRNDDLQLNGEWIGGARLVPLESATGPLKSWIAAGARAFVGAPAGLFMWSHYLADGSQSSELAVAIAHAARGAVQRLDRQEINELIELHAFPLTELTSSSGFEEGSVLLERRSGSYTEAVVAQVKAVLAAQQIEAWVGFEPDVEGNPIRLYPPLSVAGEEIAVAETDRVLSKLDVELWAFRAHLWDRPDGFWIELDDEAAAGAPVSNRSRL